MESARRRVGGSILTLASGRRPSEELKEICDPPAGPVDPRRCAASLHAGNRAWLGRGIRPPHGTGMAEMLSRDLAAGGLTILSGMAGGWIQQLTRGLWKLGARR